MKNVSRIFRKKNVTKLLVFVSRKTDNFEKVLTNQKTLNFVKKPIGMVSKRGAIPHMYYASHQSFCLLHEVCASWAIFRGKNSDH